MNLHQSPPIYIELLGPTNMYLALGIEVLVAIMLGGLIGLDREQKLKTAGVKTHILICLGAMLYTAISRVILYDMDVVGYSADVNRVGAQIVSGIGFLGAGAIIRNPKGVFGLTTAATIWVVAAIGLAIGSGFPLSATIFTLTVLVVLKFIDPAYRKLSGNFYYRLDLIGMGKAIPDVSPIFNEENVKIKTHEVFHEDENDKFILRYFLKINQKDLIQLAYKLKSLSEIKDVNYRQISSVPSDFDEMEQD